MLEKINAACRFCGQFVALGFEFEKDKVGEERAVLLCGCPESTSYQKDKELETMLAQRREETLATACVRINEIFGKDGEHDENYVSMSKTVIEHLETIAILVYDRKIGTATVDLPQESKAVIRCNAKGELIIKRQDKQNTEVVI